MALGTPGTFWRCGLMLILAMVMRTDAATLTLAATADTTLFETYPDNNFGRFSLVAGTTANLVERSRALVKFNPGGSLPQGAVISGVQITFRVNRVPHIARTSTFDLHRVLVNWGEGTGGSGSQAKGSAAKANEATWNSRLFSTADWSAPGGSAPADFADTVSGSTPLSGSTLTFASTAQLVADVQAWVNDPTTNFGWILITESEEQPGTARRFNSREVGGAPSMVITYALAQTPPTITTQPQDQTVFAGETAAFNVTPSGTAPFSFQWFLGQTSLVNATNSSLVISNVQPSDAGSYSVGVSSAGGSVTSTPAILSLAALPKIQAARVTGNALTLGFIAQPGHNYVVQFLGSLSATNWQTLTNFPPPATSTNVSVSDAIVGKERYYRLEATQAQ